VARCVMQREAVARAAAGKAADKAAPEGLHAVILNLGQLHGFMSKNDDELQVHQKALDEVRDDIAQASTPRLQMCLSSILSVMGSTYFRQYSSQIANGAEGDKGICTVAIALCKDALSIQFAHSEYYNGMAAQTLTILASAHNNVEMFDGARSTLKEALDVSTHEWLHATRKCLAAECWWKGCRNSSSTMESKASW